VSPIYVGDLAELAVDAGHSLGNRITDAIGPESPTFNELLALIKSAVHSRALIIHTPPSVALLLAGLAGRLVHDIILERWEIDAMLAGCLSSDRPPTGHTLLSEWVTENAQTLGVRYFSELARNY
jgi:NADH dehydrogenase